LNVRLDKLIGVVEEIVNASYWPGPTTEGAAKGAVVVVAPAFSWSPFAAGAQYHG